MKTIFKSACFSGQVHWYKWH